MGRIVRLLLGMRLGDPLGIQYERSTADEARPFIKTVGASTEPGHIVPRSRAVWLVAPRAWGTRPPPSEGAFVVRQW